MNKYIPSAQLRKLPIVNSSTGDSRSTLYRKIQNGLMTRGVSIGGGRVAWPEYEIEAINRARISGYSEETIRDLVTKLHHLRGQLKPGLDISAEVASIFDGLNSPQQNKTV